MANVKLQETWLTIRVGPDGTTGKVHGMATYGPSVARRSCAVSTDIEIPFDIVDVLLDLLEKNREAIEDTATIEASRALVIARDNREI